MQRAIISLSSEEDEDKEGGTSASLFLSSGTSTSCDDRMFLKSSTCYGCVNGIANQLGHMDPGGCLYEDDMDECQYSEEEGEEESDSSDSAVLESPRGGTYGRGREEGDDEVDSSVDSAMEIRLSLSSSSSSSVVPQMGGMPNRKRKRRAVTASFSFSTALLKKKGVKSITVRTPKKRKKDVVQTKAGEGDSRGGLDEESADIAELGLSDLSD